VNAYHNLAGWLRDVRSVLGDRTELADSYYWQLRDLLEEVLELVGDDVSDSDALEPEDADDDVVVQRPRDSGDAGAQRGGARARRQHPLGGAARMANLLPRDVQEEGRQRRSRTAALAAAGQPLTAAAVKRVETVQVPLAEANARRATIVTRRTTVKKKGAAHGTRKTKRTR